MDSVHGRKWQRSVRWAAVIGLLSLLLASVLVSADVDLKTREGEEMVVVVKYPTEEYNYRQVWPTLKFGWRIVVGSVIGFFGAAFGSVGGVGGGGIFVPVLILIIGFDAKSSTAISKCMITGMAASILCYKLKMRHPTLDMPIIDYDLALLFQPMLMLGISIGVAFNVIFPDWLVTVLLIILFLGTATKTFFKGIETWKKETIIIRAAALPAFSNGGGSNIEYKLLPSVRDGDTYKEINAHEESEVPVLQNICWKEFSLLFFVWVVFLALQISKDYTAICSTWYWVLNLVQIPVSVGVTLYAAVSLYKGTRVIASKGEQGTNWRIHQLLFYCFCGILAGIVGGLLGLGGGFILAPLFLELGIPPQVSSATATFAMAFSSSMSVVEYYLLNRFPVPYALYFVVVATVAAFLGQHIVRWLIIVLGRASFIIFIMAFTILFSALSLGGVYLPDMIQNIQRLDHMGFDNLCKYRI